MHRPGDNLLPCWLKAALALLLLPGLALAQDADASESASRPYVPVPGISGNLNSIGSDTFNTVMTVWAEEFRTIYPRVVVGVEGKGSSTAPPALALGNAQLGPMSRPMRASEIEAFVSRHGYAPTGIPVAVDALAVFVHRDNPLEGLTLAQVDAIFSDTLRRGGPDVENWSDLGLQGRWQERSFSLYGRNSASGTYGFFKTQALQQGDFRDDVHEQPGSSAVVQAVAGDLYAMGYTAVGYTTPAVRTLPIAGPNGIFYTPTEENCVGERYPLARFLYVYIDLPPDEALDDLTGEFIRYVLSDDGQRVVRRFGFFGLAPELLAQVESEILPVAP